jgi:lipopolysaccharide transport system permease protein
VLRDLRLRYKQAVMGFLWAVLMPVLIICSGILIKYVMAQMSGEAVAPESLAGMSVKALGWAFFIGAIGFATGSIVANMNLVTKIYFPREVIPLASVVTQVFDSAIGSAATALFLFGFLRVGLSLEALWAVPLGLLIVLFTSGAAMLLSCANVFFRDVKYLVQVVLMFGIFFTPVFYDPQFLGPVGCRLIMLNPLAPLLEGLCQAVAEKHSLLEPIVVLSSKGQEVLAWTPWYLVYAAVCSVLVFLGGWLIFHRLASKFPEYV